MAAMTFQVELGPATRELLERLAGKVTLQVELGPKTRDVIEDFIATREPKTRTRSVKPR
jgi:hypothetical protein